MVSIKDKRCIVEYCNNTALYKHVQDKKYMYCDTHKTDDMITDDNLKCEECDEIGQCKIDNKLCCIEHIDVEVTKKSVSSPSSSSPLPALGSSSLFGLQYFKIFSGTISKYEYLEIFSETISKYIISKCLAKRI